MSTENSQFPSTRAEALAMLWVQTRDLSSSSPEELQRLYFSALKQIRQDFKAHRTEYSTQF